MSYVISVTTSNLSHPHLNLSVTNNHATAPGSKATNTLTSLPTSEGFLTLCHSPGFSTSARSNWHNSYPILGVPQDCIIRKTLKIL